VGGLPALSRWIECARSSQTISFVVCDEESRERVQEWCETSGFHPTNLIASNSWQSSLKSLASNRGQVSRLVIIHADHILEPTFDLQRLLNHAAVLNKPILCCYQDAQSTSSPALPCPDPNLQVLLHPGNACCRVAGLLQHTGGSHATTEQCPAYMGEEPPGKLRWGQLVPIYIIDPAWLLNSPSAEAITFQSLQNAAENGSLYALRVECWLPLTSQVAADFADGFYNYFARETRDPKPTAHPPAFPHDTGCSLGSGPTLERRLLDAFSEMSALSKGPPDPSAGRELPPCFQVGKLEQLGHDTYL
jgi:hypothetical protein